MKKILGIAFATILLSSCSQTPSVIGTWRLDSVTMDGQEIPIDDCKKKSIVIFQDGGKAVIHSFYEMPENKECKEVISEKNFTISGNTIKSIDNKVSKRNNDFFKDFFIL